MGGGAQLWLGLARACTLGLLAKRGRSPCGSALLRNEAVHTRHVAQKAQCARASLHTQPEARAFGQATLHARGRAVCRAMPKLCMTRGRRPNLSNKHTSPDPHRSCPIYRRKGAIRAGFQMCVITSLRYGAGRGTHESDSNNQMQDQKSNNQNPTNTTFPSHSLTCSESKQSKSLCVLSLCPGRKK